MNGGMCKAERGGEWVCAVVRGRVYVEVQGGGIKWTRKSEGVLRIQKGGGGDKRCCIGVVVVCVSRVVEKPPAISPRMDEVCRVLSREN